MTSSRRVRGALLFLALASAPAAALAQRTAVDVETARDLYNKGRELKEHGDLRGALEKFKAAHAVGRTPITGLALAQAYAALAQPVEAREVCLGIARLPVTAEETSRSAEARAAAAKLAEEVKPRIATLRLRLKGVPRGAEPTATIDGATIPPAALDEPRQVDPGAHAFVARVGKGAETRGSVELKEGEAREVEVVVVPPPPEPVAQSGGPTPGRPVSEQRLSPLVIPGFTVAAVGVGVGAVTGLLTVVGKSDLDARCLNSHCGPSEYDALDRARLMGTVSTIAFIVGGVGAGVGLYGLTHPVRVTREKAGATLRLGPGYVGVHATF